MPANAVNRFPTRERTFSIATNEASISVIVPVYNGARYISQALESILNQTRRPGEILVIDDGSTDDTARVVGQFGDSVVYHYQKNMGSSVSRNRGVGLASGQLLAFLDADDLWTEDKIAIQLAALDANPNLDLVWGHVVEFRGETPATGSCAAAIAGHHPGTMLVRREAFTRIGNFSEAYQEAEVVEWMTRVLQCEVSHLMLRETLMFRRIHEANKGLSNPAANRQYLAILKNHLDKKRAK